MSLAEKFQITVPAKEEAGEGWADFESARDTHYVEEQHSKTRPDGDKFNDLPPGMDIGNQMRCDPTEYQGFVKGFGGDTDVTGDVEPKSLDQGFRKREMKATDDQYTGEHIDLWYGDDGGFVERNNYLDRM